MKYRLRCPQCRQKLQFGERLLGREIKCPSCGSAVKIPPAQAEPVTGDRPSIVSPPVTEVTVPPVARVSSNPPDIIPPPSNGDRQSWFEWLLFGASPKQREIKREAIQQAREFESAASQLAHARKQAELDLQAAIADLRQQHVQDALADMPVKRLKEFGSSLRVKALEAAGYLNVADLLDIPSSQLQTLDGIGPASAAQVVRAITQLSEHLQNEPMRIPPPDELDVRYLPLLNAAYRRVRCRRITGKSVAELRAVADTITRSVSNAKRTGNLLNRLFRRATVQDQLGRDYQQLEQFCKSPSTTVLVIDARHTLAD